VLRAVPASALAGGQLDRVRAIYEEAFPPELRVPFAELDDGGPDDGGLIVALDGDVPAGFASLRRLAAAMFVRYFAVAAARRRQGAGRRLWHLLPGAVPGWPGRVVFEVEDPAETGDPAEQLVRRGRIAFWRSCGTALLPVPGYVMPDLTGAGTEPMLLMAAPACAGEELRQLVQSVYTGRYGLPASDPLVRRALDSV
jgi:GNAT superfamily N-acetyltransferase